MTSHQSSSAEAGQDAQPPLPNTAAIHALGAGVEAALLRELQRLHGEVNATFFKRRMDPAVVALSGSTRLLGRWISRLRTIEMSWKLVLDHPWGEVVEVMKHEMAHQYVDEVVGATDETAHGPAFREVCETLGIDARASASGAPSEPVTQEEQRVLQRVARLLALAESSNQHEAQAAMNAAQRLMLKHNLEEIAASAKESRRYVYRHVGEPSGRVSESGHILGAILAEHFFVEVIWVPAYRPRDCTRASVLEVCGTHANVEMAAYVHSFLTHTAEQLWNQHKRTHDLRSNRDRRTFLAGVMAGFRDKLRAARTAQQTEGLVWIKDGDLSSFYRKRHPSIRHSTIAGNRRTEAHAQGREAGRGIVLHRPVGSGESGGTRLLSAGSRRSD